MTFTIQYPDGKHGKAGFCRRFGLNAYYEGKHWGQRKKDVDELHAMTLAAMRRAKIPQRLFERPVKVKFCWDDRRKWLKAVSPEMWNGGCIKVEVSEVDET